MPHPNTEKTFPVLRTLAAAVACLSAIACMSLLGGPARADEAGAVGFLSGHGELTPSKGLSSVADELSSRYAIREVELAAGDSLSGVGVLVVAGNPDIPDAELYEIDHYLMRGGRILFLLDAALLPEQGFQSNVSPANVFGFLETYGVVVNPDLVFDRSCATGASWNQVSTDDPYPLWPRLSADNISSQGPLAGLTSLQLAFSSSITTSWEMPGSTRADVLARSSDESWTESAYTSLDPESIPTPGVRSAEATKVAADQGFPLAVSVAGRFESAFRDRKLIVEREGKVEVVDPVDMIELGATTAMVVFGSSVSFSDEFVGLYPENVDVLRRTVDWLAGDAPLVEAPAGATASPDRRTAASGAGRAPEPGGSAAWPALLFILAALGAAAALMLARHRRRRGPAERSPGPRR